MKILVIYGSLRSNSLNKALAFNIAKLAPEEMEIDVTGIEGIPLYTDSLEKMAFPEIVTKLKERIEDASGILVVTPEYNRSMPGALKNAIDWTSRGKVPWKQKAVGVIGASDGVRGASFAQYDVKRIMTYFSAFVMGQPEFYFAEADKKIDAEGNITDEKSKEALAKYLAAFKEHVKRFA